MSIPEVTGANPHLCEKCGTTITFPAVSMYAKYGVVYAALGAVCMRAHDEMLEDLGLASRMIECYVLEARQCRNIDTYDGDGNEISAASLLDRQARLRADLRAAMAEWLPATPPPPIA